MDLKIIIAVVRWKSLMRTNGASILIIEVASTVDALNNHADLRNRQSSQNLQSFRSSQSGQHAKSAALSQFPRVTTLVIATAATELPSLASIVREHCPAGKATISKLGEWGSGGRLLLSVDCL